jgi:nicotinamidase-related amidase
MAIEPRVHDWRIDEREYARHETRRGRRHAFARIDPRRTALVVIDMVPFHVADSSSALGIVDHINALAGALRAAGGTVAWVLNGSGPPSAAMRARFGDEIAERYAAAGGDGPLPERLWPALRARPDDDVWVEKSAASAFFPGRCPLPGHLADRNIDTVLITGTVTSVCCESSARDAATLGYRVIMVADANADVGDDPHNATLRTIYRSFGDVRPTDAVLDLIATGP